MWQIHGWIHMECGPPGNGGQWDGLSSLVWEQQLGKCCFCLSACTCETETVSCCCILPPREEKMRWHVWYLLHYKKHYERAKDTCRLAIKHQTVYSHTGKYINTDMQTPTSLSTEETQCLFLSVVCPPSSINTKNRIQKGCSAWYFCLRDMPSACWGHQPQLLLLNPRSGLQKDQVTTA